MAISKEILIIERINDQLERISKYNSISKYHFFKRKKLNNTINDKFNSISELDIFDVVKALYCIVNGKRNSANMVYKNNNIKFQNGSVMIKISENESIIFVKNTANVEEPLFSYTIIKGSSIVPFISKKWNLVKEKAFKIIFEAMYDLAELY